MSWRDEDVLELISCEGSNVLWNRADLPDATLIPKKKKRTREKYKDRRRIQSERSKGADHM